MTVKFGTKKDQIDQKKPKIMVKEPEKGLKTTKIQKRKRLKKPKYLEV